MGARYKLGNRQGYNMNIDLDHGFSAYRSMQNPEPCQRLIAPRSLKWLVSYLIQDVRAVTEVKKPRTALSLGHSGP